MNALTGLTEGLELLELGARLVVATLLGAVIGWNRERADKPAGLRTHMLVALGSAAFLVLGLEIDARLTGMGPGVDPTRVLQGVVGGIGFLGAGSILKAHGHVTGVTTAASVWISGALGAAAGVGAYAVAAATTLLAFLTLAFVDKLERKLRPSENAARRGPGSDDGGGDQNDSAA